MKNQALSGQVSRIQIQNQVWPNISSGLQAIHAVGERKSGKQLDFGQSVIFTRD